MSFWSAIVGLATAAFTAFNPVAFLIDVAITWAIGEVLTSDVEKDIDKRYSGTLLNKQSNNAQIPAIYGQRRAGGTRSFMATGGTDNAYLYLVLVLCEGEIQEIGDVYINDVISTDARYSGLITINKHLGSDSQAADTMLTGAGIDWTTNHRLRGLAYIACKFKWDANVFGSLPTIHCDIKGRKVYDPRNSTTAYSTNPALCWRDYLTNSRFGKGLAAGSIDDTAVTAAANKCDTLVTPYTGASQIKLFECNAIIDTSRSIIDNCRVLLSGMRGLMPYSEGKYGVIVEDQKVGSTAFDFTEDHIIGGISIESERKKDKYNRVIATFANPAKGWQSDNIEWPKTNSTDHNTYLSEDNSTELVGRIDLPTITSPYTAEDIAELVVKRSRDALKVGLVVTSEGLKCSVGDIISITHSTCGWSAKEFRIMAVTLNPDCSVQLECLEHQDNIYPWGTKSEEASTPDTNLPVRHLNDITSMSPQRNNSAINPTANYYIQANTWIYPRDFFWAIHTISQPFTLSNAKIALSMNGVIDVQRETKTSAYYNYWYAGWVYADVDGVPLSTWSGGYDPVWFDGSKVLLLQNWIGYSEVGFDEIQIAQNVQKSFANGHTLAANTYYKMSDLSLITSEISEVKMVFGVWHREVNVNSATLYSWSRVNTAVTVFSR
jgi:hypothetical protein